MKWKHIWIGALAALPLAAAAQPNFAGRTVTIIVGYMAGGGYDAAARLLARHLPKHIPGNPAVIVQNMPGANSIIAANHMYNVAKPDGLSIGTFNRNLPIAQLTNVQGVKYDVTKFQWIGSAANESTILAIRTDLPYKNFEDLLGVNLKIVSGYQSSADIMLAVERKEVDGRAGSYTSLRPFIDRGLVRPVVRARSVEPGIEKLPVDEEMAPNARAKAIMALRSAPEQVARPYVLPPATRADIVKAMRDAFARTIQDPELVAESKKAKFDLEFLPGDQAQKILVEVMKQPKDIVDEFSKYIKFGE